MTTISTKSTYRSATRLVLALTLCLHIALSASCGTSAAVPDVELDAGAAGTPSPTLQGSVCDVGVHGDLENVHPIGQIVIYWHPYAGANEELLHRLVDEFNRTNGSGIVVLAESHDGTARLHGSIEDGIALGRLPDLTTARPEYVATYAQEGVLASLDCYVTSPRWGYPQLAGG
ncbi:unnamed protein product, partial [marine sediment metagenome]